MSDFFSAMAVVMLIFCLNELGKIHAHLHEMTEQATEHKKDQKDDETKQSFYIAPE